MRKFLLIAASIFILSCEMDINPDLGEAQRVLVVDAWINDKPEPQNIFISRSQPYFDNSFPEKVPGATVTVFNELGAQFDFIENDSAYTWVSPDGTSFGNPDSFYTLTVNLEGEDYSSFAYMGPVPPIDSIKYSLREPEFGIDEEYYLAEFVSRDIVGEGNTYWIKAWKNGQLLNKPSEINIAFDAGFSAGGVVDGKVFIQPIQSGINPFDEVPDSPGEFVPPFLPDDSVYVELLSIDIQAFFFLNETAIQTNRAGGFAALFAVPLANVPSNISNIDPNSEAQVVGFFQVSSVSGLGRKLDEEAVEEAQLNAQNN